VWTAARRPFHHISGRSPASPMVTLRRVEAADSSMLGYSAAAPPRSDRGDRCARCINLQDIVHESAAGAVRVAQET
jgi:hypothetical protein